MQSSCQGSKGEVWGADRKTPISWQLSQGHNASAPPSFRAGAWAGGHATHTVPAHTVGARYEIPMQLHLFCLQHKSFLGVAEVHLTFSSLRTRLHLEMRWLHASRPLQGKCSKIPNKAGKRLVLLRVPATVCSQVRYYHATEDKLSPWLAKWTLIRASRAQVAPGSQCTHVAKTHRPLAPQPTVLRGHLVMMLTCSERLVTGGPKQDKTSTDVRCQ
ncbi:hypothetical protein Anapl_16359 [Anas platyrhynchos]|uniref:Uncharacterized protein n=1 Tax=Anas platyrhynchos TaxID=8839 RepID=R0J7U3_ANAPL|nr:hypothetical protein Anapl_16359 [Anas platyrhynchos]